MSNAGDICLLCVEIKEKANRRHVVQRLVKIGGAVVCTHCDSVAAWPSQSGPSSRRGPIDLV